MSALSYPSLWARLPKIDLQKVDLSASPDLSRFNECLRRSGSVPLEICIIGHPENPFHHSAHIITALITEFSHRWRKLELETSFWFLTLMDSINGKIPLLEELHLNLAWAYHSQPNSSYHYVGDVNIFKVAPRLTRVTFDGAGSRCFQGTLHLPYSELIHYNNGLRNIALDRFHPHNRLQTLTVIKGNYNSVRMLSGQTDSAGLSLRMPNLKKLVIRVDYIHDLSFFHLLNMTAIEELDFCTRAHGACQAVLLMMVRASPAHLTRLSLVTWATPAGEVPEVLKNTPALTDLCLLVWHPSDILAMASIQNNVVLVPCLEHCCFHFHSLGDPPGEEIGNAVLTLARSRCEMDFPTRLRRLKTLKIRSQTSDDSFLSLERIGSLDGCFTDSINEPILQQAFFEEWSREPCELSYLKHNLLIALEKNHGTGVDLAWKRRVSNELAQIENYVIGDPREILVSLSFVRLLSFMFVSRHQTSTFTLVKFAMVSNHTNPLPLKTRLVTF